MGKIIKDGFHYMECVRKERETQLRLMKSVKIP